MKTLIKRNPDTDKTLPNLTNTVLTTKQIKYHPKELIPSPQLPTSQQLSINNTTNKTTNNTDFSDLAIPPLPSAQSQATEATPTPSSATSPNFQQFLKYAKNLLKLLLENNCKHSLTKVQSRRQRTRTCQHACCYAHKNDKIVSKNAVSARRRERNEAFTVCHEGMPGYSCIITTFKIQV